MRIWDISVEKLCRKHLLGEHRELHAIWSIILNNKKGYAHHPETLRWRGKLHALYLRHEALTEEMKRRGYRHNSLLEKTLATGERIQTEFIDTLEKQKQLLKKKQCGCKV